MPEEDNSITTEPQPQPKNEIAIPVERPIVDTNSFMEYKNHVPKLQIRGTDQTKEQE